METATTPPVLRALIEKHPVLTFYILTFAFSWGAGLLLTGGALLSGEDSVSNPRFLMAITLGTLGPAAACLLLTGILSGRAGYEELRARLFRWHVAAHWYAAALLPAPLVATATGVLLAAPSGSSEFLPAIVTTEDPFGLLLPGIAAGLMAGFFEEIGWTGFATPRLRLRLGALVTGLFVGVIWGAWHFPLFLESDSFSDGLSLALLLVALFSWLPPYRVLMVWVFDGTQSLLLPILMHVSLSGSQVIFLPEDLSDTQALVSMLARAGAWWMIVAVVVVVNRRYLATRASQAAISSPSRV
jgi:membrane protease YdiL (CAAX protease family)